MKSIKSVELKSFLSLQGGDRPAAGDSPIYSLFDEVWNIRKSLHFELIKTNFDKHDKNHFETTLTYQRVGSKKQNIREYEVDFFFFVPNSVIPDGYSNQKFLSDLTNHMRLRSPELKPSAFLDLNNLNSPFGKLHEIKSRLLKKADLDLSEEILKEFRTAAVYILSTLTRINVTKLVGREYDLGFHYNVELELSRELLKVFRLIFREYNSIFYNRFDSALKKCSMIEEYLSYHAEKAWLPILESDEVRALPELRDRIRLFLLEEYKYRKDFEFLTDTSPESLSKAQVGEVFSYRLGVLKKFIHEQLYLRVKYKNNSSHAIQSAAMIAAAFAAIFAYSIEMFNRGYLGYSWEYNAGVLLAISSFAYVLKDRIKECTRSLFQGKWRRYDLRRDLRLSDKNKKLARTIEKVELVDSDKVPEKVLKLRNKTAFSELKEHRTEKVIHYSKKVRINWAQLKKLESKKAKSLKEIYRFDLSPFLRQMDDPIREMDFFDPKTGEPASVELPRVYHVNCILSLKPISDKKSNVQPSLFKVRVVMDKKGIKRIEF